MNQAFRFALRDLRGSKAGLRLLAVCLFLGVMTLAAIGSLSSAILSELSTRGQVILGGDIQMEASQRYASPEERGAFDAVGDLSETVRMRAMASTEDGSTAVLSELKGVDSAYPLYGRLRLERGALALRPTGNQVAIAPALAEKLGVTTGGTLRIGDARLRIIGIIAEEPDRVGEGFTLGPVAMVDMDGIKATALVQPGSLFTTRYRIKTPRGVNPAKTAAALSSAFPGAGWEVQDRSNGAPGTRRFIERLGQFLALVGLSSLVIAGIGVGNGVASWLDGKRTSIATFKVLGSSSKTIFQIYLFQLIMVAGFAIFSGLAVGALAPWAIATFAGDALPVAPTLAIFPAPLITSAAFGVLIALLFSLAPLARAHSVTAASLFRTTVEGARRPTIAVSAAMAIIAVAIILIAVLTAPQPLFAALFIACVLGLLILLTGLGIAIQAGAARLPRPRRPILRLAFANLHRPGAQTSRLVVALGLGLTLFSTLAFVQTNLARQIESAIPKRAPSFFALDIPKEEEGRFRRAVLAAAPTAVIATVPTLRGPVVALGDKRVAEMKDIPEAAWFLRGDRGLTFASKLPQGSRVVAGKWWPENYAGPPLVSVDERAADAVGLKIGDRMTVSVLGVEIEAQIASLREINWDTMGFNFVLVFSPGSLDAAPYTLAATIAADGARETQVARAVSTGFPAVSMIKVKDVITQVGALLGQLGSAVGIAASVAVLAGIAVLVGAIAASRRTRSYDAVILKMLGASRGQVLMAQATEYALLALILSVIALLIGGVAGWFVVTRIFELGWSPGWSVIALTIAGGGFGTLILGLIGALPALNARPAEALRSL
ncbi:MAG: FtsX-like permease family protein [Chakrabartia sp.]